MDQLSLFDADEYYQFPQELLEYTDDFLPENEATALKAFLMETTPWIQTTQKMYDKEVLTPRLTAWYGDEGKAYQLSGTRVVVNPWTSELLALKNRLEHFSGYTFNSVLLNLYRNGNDSVAWHRDRDSRFGNRPVIASLSLGQVRNFDFRKFDDHQVKYSLALSHGSLLIMKGDLQLHWEHRIAKSVKPMQPRINLTFRLIKEL
ncbi:alpha-ketoglutarate-dependent dioxygenase AlkB [Chryseobacterium sp. ISL-6]|jgi:alkylated DNA repair dioxygenase AlkB|uniref:alpha-ketoglutarate-dependent dioxygenase AlkB family protein n=1 Tax=Chryseobacterium sp. ISL-6 TaxID=2819143 RepID=UPI001BE934A3|nr:alpha-ketoglutarate-dependent dioxygenase AlkB [Chryseobacterium sp. ISL-6]MBT2619446.1 alpha-ketoglutarate-dependent dioxygenase AlkB [Chryseobacterium sp. ISL-6]